MKPNRFNRIKPWRELVAEAVATADDILKVIREAKTRGLTVELFNRVSDTLATTRRGMERMRSEMVGAEERELLTPEWFDRYQQLSTAKALLSTLRPTHGLN